MPPFYSILFLFSFLFLVGFFSFYLQPLCFLFYTFLLLTAYNINFANNRDLYQTFCITDKYPTDCKDYFRRDNLFQRTNINTCTAVTIDPQGPGLVTATNPPAFRAQCCKRSATRCCTEVRQIHLFNL